MAEWLPFHVMVHPIKIVSSISIYHIFWAAKSLLLILCTNPNPWQKRGIKPLRKLDSLSAIASYEREY
jgi:hypothetical protein